jgi:hypothetical protein
MPATNNAGSPPRPARPLGHAKAPVAFHFGDLRVLGLTQGIVVRRSVGDAALALRILDTTLDELMKALAQSVPW